ncbi:MAG: formylglycine-generating enzyme family protein [Bacteroidales bacterium]
MKLKTTFIAYAITPIMLISAATLQSVAINYSINFTAVGGVTTSVGNVQVQNLTKGTSVIVPEGNTLTLTDQITADDMLNANDERMRVSQTDSPGVFLLTFCASHAGIAQITTYALNGIKVIGLISNLNVGNHSLELTLPTGMYIVRVSGPAYSYSAKLQNKIRTTTHSYIKFLPNQITTVTSSQKSKAEPMTSIIMNYASGDQLLYTATSSTYVSSVPDVPTDSKTINFKFATLATSALPAGTYSMGSPADEVHRYTNETQHQVTLSAFRISKYEITNTQFATFLNEKGIGSSGIWATAPVYKTQGLITANSLWGLTYNGSQWVSAMGYENAPVIDVTWYGAVEYATFVGGTLPTEAQWEYACRAGTTTPFNTGNFLTNLQANYDWRYPYNNGTNTDTAYPNKTQTVGLYPPNAWGLYDMHGNACEWCYDWYASVYPTTPQTDPTGPNSGLYRVYRGGCWYFYAYNCRTAYRVYDYPNYEHNFLGFRVVFVQ